MKKQWLALAAVLTLASAACGGEDDAGVAPAPEAAGDGGTRQVTLGLLPILPSAPYYLCEQQGLFSEAGFEVEVQSGQGGAALLPSVVAGQLDFAISNPVSLMLAQGQGLDVRVLSNWANSRAEGEDINAVVAAGDSGIAQPADLAGKRVAVNTLRTMGELTIRESVAQDGGDPNAVQFVELPFPDMPSAMQQGNVDAIWVPEPFLTISQDQGAQVVTYPGQDVAPGHPTLMLFGGGQTVDDDPQLAQDFAEVVGECLEYAESNPEELRAVIPEFLPQMDPALLDRVALEEFTAEVPRDTLEQLGELMVQDGYVEQAPDLDALLPAES